MSEDNLYHVVVQRREQAGQVQLNYTDKERADQAMLEIAEFRRNTMIGGITPVKTFTDDFGCAAIFDQRDIGNIVLEDHGGALRMRLALTLMDANAQANAQSIFNAGRGRVLVPGGPVPANLQKYD